MDNKILAVILAVIVVVAAVGVGAYALIGNNDKTNDVTIDAQVSIYGNANNDAYIDNDASTKSGAGVS